MARSKIKQIVKYAVKYTKVLLLFFDIVVLNASFFAAILIRFGSFQFPYQNDYLRLLALGNLLWILLIGVFDAYKIMRFEPVEMMLKRTFRMCLVHFPLFMLLTYIIDFRDSSRFVFIVFFLIMTTTMITYRVILFELLKKLRRRGVNHKLVAIVGYNDNAKDIYEVLTADIAYGYKVLGFLTDENVNPKEVRYLGKIDDIEEVLLKYKVEEIYIALTTTNTKRVRHIFKVCDRFGVRVKIIPDFQKYTSSHIVQIRYYNHIPVLQRRREPLALFVNKAVKRIFDIVFSLFVLVFLVSWIYPLTAILVRWESKGPILFRQKRSGLDGKVFTCYKIRTMVVDAGETPKGTQNNDPRITKLGRFLRKSRIDELPQFFNVLIGNMSVVGPRPHMLVHTEEYGELIDEFMVRHFVKPGITGWAQTVGELNPDQKLKEMREKVQNDLWYIENWSFLLDIKIIVNTTLKIFQHDPNAK